MAKSKSKPTIFFYVSGYAQQKEGRPWFIIRAMGSDGVLLEEIESPELGEGKIGVGYAPNEKDELRNDDLFNGHFPKGFKSEWVEKPPKHKGVQNAEELFTKSGQDKPLSLVPESPKSDKSDNVEDEDDDQAKEPAFVKKQIVRRLPIEPPESELAKYFKELAEVTSSIKTLKNEIKEYSKGKNDEIKIFEKRQTELCTLPEQGTVLEDVECTVHFDWEASEKSIFRNDTNELVDKEPITIDEKQQNLDLGEGGESGLVQPHTEGGQEKEATIQGKSETEKTNQKQHSADVEPNPSPPDPKAQATPPSNAIPHPKPAQAVNLENDNPEKNRIDAKIGPDWEMIAFEDIQENMLFKVTWFKEDGRDSNQIYKAVGVPEDNKVTCELFVQ